MGAAPHPVRIARPAVLAACLAAGAAFAQDCAGTWDGRLAGAPVMLQFNWERLGAYYTGTAPTGPVLRPRQQDARTWDEYDAAGQHTATLHIACSADALEGERIANGGARAALQARRAEENSFNRRRLAAAELVVQRAVRENGRVLELVAVRGFPQLATVRIRQPGPGEAKVNQRLRAALLQQLDNHLQCQALLRGEGHFDHPGGDTLSLQRLDWHGAILSVQFWLHGACGSQEGYSGAQQFTFDTRTGDELPLAQWLLPEYAPGIAPGTPLHEALVLPQILRGRARLDDLPPAKRECAEFEMQENAMPIAVEGGGIAFGFQYSAQTAACSLAFVLPWAKLQPFLSDHGRRWREAMQPACPNPRAGACPPSPARTGRGPAAP